MTVAYREIIPWGRSWAEYRLMFALGPEELGKTILGCGDGPAAFNARVAASGGRARSVDPLYLLAGHQIAARIEATFGRVLEQTGNNRDRFVWKQIPDIEELGRRRRRAMREFLDDYEAGRRAGRYLPAALPRLPFRGGTFDLALCSHLLFLYSDHLDARFHLEAIREMLRVAREIRIFPLCDLQGESSPWFDGVCRFLEANGVWFEVEDVSYEFLKGGNRMLRALGGSSG